MFGIIQPRYLQGLAPEEMRGMVRFFGRRMGLSFAFDACDYLHERYGGHPLLTRMACSEVHEAGQRRNKERPLDISKADLIRDEDDRDSELVFYCRHVVSELKKFYPDEYELLEMLASGQVVDVMDLAEQPEFTRHLKEYGLLKTDDVKRPLFAIPVVGQYVGNEMARREHRRLVRKVVRAEDREGWVRRRCDTITRELRELNRVIKEKNLAGFFGVNAFPEAERFLTLKPTNTNDEFVTFINTCNRCFVEAVEQFGRSQNKADFFWKEFKQNYPDLWEGFQRVKIYRHNDLHLELNAIANAELKRFIEIDLEGRRISQVGDVWFVLQQSVLDGLLLGVQCELNRLN